MSMMKAVLCLALLTMAVAAFQEDFMEVSSSCSNSVCSALCKNQQNKCGGICKSGICVCSECQINGNWSPWTNWSPCTRTCGTGMKQRRRTCTNPRPSNGGSYCIGDSLKYELCSTKTCAVNGKWAAWSSWSKCSTTCGSGLRQRSRTCTDPKPTYGGENCQGDPEEYKLCTQGECKKVSFTAAYPSASSYSKGQTIVFTHITNNDGKAYNPLTGQFIAPVDGKYIFAVTIVTKSKNEADVRLMANHKQIGQVLANYDYYGNFGSGSVTSFTDLRKGDMVYVQFMSGTCGAAIYQSTSYQSYFAGALI